jgi:outer membrane receptor protein involved in Fe transport
MGFATLTSSSSWAHHNNSTHDDLGALYENFNFYQSLYGQDPRAVFVSHDALDDKIYAQEFRVASKTGGAFDWITGLYYKDEKTYIQEHEYEPGYNAFYNACTASGLYPPTDYSGVNASACGAGEQPQGTYAADGIANPVDMTYIGDIETTFKDLALFGELTWHPAEDWSVTGGTRLFKQTVSQAQQTGLLFDGPAYVSANSLSNEWRRALWKINASYQLDKTNLVYATWSQGFRRGGVNALPSEQPLPARQGTVGTTCLSGPNAGFYCLNPSLSTYQPDKADNYEIGIKGVFENRISYSADIYDIEWHNIQEGTSLTPLSLPSAANVGDATSRGLELDATASITHHLAVKLGYTYDQTKVTSFNFVFSQNVTVPLPSPGGPLPGTPKSSGSLGLEYAHVDFADGELLYALDAHYQGRIISAISETAIPVPGYTMLDGRITFTRSHWLGTFYVDNITNTLGVNAITDPTFWGNRTQEVISRPRTFGLTFAYSFKER